MEVAKQTSLSIAAAVTNWFSRRRSLQRLVFNAMRLNRPEISHLLTDYDLKFLSYCFSRRSNSKSQIMQDLWVCFELGDKTRGFFVEFGATNGLKNSNTWLLEKTFGWNGILAEPNPVWHTELARNRAVSIEHNCVSSRSGDTVIFITTDDTDPELSAIASFSDGDHFAELRSNSKSIQKDTISLDDLLDKYNAPHEIDYMSIDTEGSELEILSSYSFSHKFKLISVEQNKNTEHKIQSLLEEQGYVRVFPQFSQWDGWYVSAGVRGNMNSEITAPAA